MHRKLFLWHVKYLEGLNCCGTQRCLLHVFGLDTVDFVELQ